MPIAKIVICLLMALCIHPALANEEDSQIHYRWILEKAGFFGDYATGVSVDWNDRHATDLSLGRYRIDDSYSKQLNLSYRYSRWQVLFRGDEWRPVQYGAFVIHSIGDDRFFSRSPSKYPYPDYYDPTAFRFGMEFSSTWTFKPENIALALRLRVFDTGLIAGFNNENRNLQYFSSSGLSLQYVF